MNYCPLMSYGNKYVQEVSCLGPNCAFSDGVGDCLIEQTLQLYVSGERTRRAEEADRSKREMEMALAYWENMKNSDLRKATLIEDPSPCVDGNYIDF